MLGQFTGRRADLDLVSAEVDCRGRLHRRGSTFEGQLHSEAATQPLLTYDSDVPAHAFDEALADRQAQPRATDQVAGAGLIERLEDMQLLLLVDPDTGIGYLEPQRHLCIRAFQHLATQYDTANAGELDRIAHQVVQHLAQFGHVAEQLVRYPWIGAGIDLQALAPGTDDMRRDDLLDHLQWREGGGLERQLAGLYLRNIQYITDDLQDRRRGRLNRLQIVALALVQSRQPQQLQGAQYTVERRAYFVAHGGEEDGFGLVRPLGLLLGLVQGKRALLVLGDIRERTQLHLLLLVASR
ncbi:hypothetical protein D3C76_562750 [compost metagenome]